MKPRLVFTDKITLYLTLIFSLLDSNDKRSFSKTLIALSFSLTGFSSCASPTTFSSASEILVSVLTTSSFFLSRSCFFSVRKLTSWAANYKLHSSQWTSGRHNSIIYYKFIITDDRDYHGVFLSNVNISHLLENRKRQHYIFFCCIRLHRVDEIIIN